MANPLGECEKCHGPLCVSGRQVKCEQCGHIVTDHPAVTVPEKPAPVPISLPPQDFQSNWQDRIAALERELKALKGRVAVLEVTVAKQKSKAAA